MVDIAKVEEVVSSAITEAESNREFSGDEIVKFAAEKVRNDLGISCVYEYTGGFDSPGYRIDCYAIAYVTDDGDVGIYAYQYELY
ncbi:hypothetical protein PghCCS26_47420 [Paenibacillus glycanilyticus]|uniref:Uncharacterized protein n=1 Tax=Paenibacillus glycanilyticus TaxID=126569 RepID=A0ABQ6NU01_9BACL|nr:hypothetical protein [Paenibacillus glycanilyticus]GMK47612.1 hypothetical protein PghCCS26_47420 [Paenibacillus glycanilyticus]